MIVWCYAHRKGWLVRWDYLPPPPSRYRLTTATTCPAPHTCTRATFSRRRTRAATTPTTCWPVRTATTCACHHYTTHHQAILPAIRAYQSVRTGSGIPAFLLTLPLALLYVAFGRAFKGLCIQAAGRTFGVPSELIWYYGRLTCRAATANKPYFLSL